MTILSLKLLNTHASNLGEKLLKQATVEKVCHFYLYQSTKKWNDTLGASFNMIKVIISMQRNSTVFSKVIEFFMDQMRTSLADLQANFDDLGVNSDETEYLFQLILGQKGELFSEKNRKYCQAVLLIERICHIANTCSQMFGNNRTKVLADHKSSILAIAASHINFVLPALNLSRIKAVQSTQLKEL